MVQQIYAAAVSASEIVPVLPARVCVEDVVWQTLDGLVVILAFTPTRNYPSARYYRLDDTGSRMWELLTDSGDVATAFAQLCDEFEVDASRLRRDLHDFIERLVDAGLVRVDASGA